MRCSRALFAAGSSLQHASSAKKPAENPRLWSVWAVFSSFFKPSIKAGRADPFAELGLSALRKGKLLLQPSVLGSPEATSRALRLPAKLCPLEAPWISYVGPGSSFVETLRLRALPGTAWWAAGWVEAALVLWAKFQGVTVKMPVLKFL